MGRAVRTQDGGAVSPAGRDPTTEAPASWRACPTGWTGGGTGWPGPRRPWGSPGLPFECLLFPQPSGSQGMERPVRETSPPPPVVLLATFSEILTAICFKRRRRSRDQVSCSALNNGKPDRRF